MENNAEKELAELLHTLLCNRKHSSDMTILLDRNFDCTLCEDCLWYLESSLDTEWIQPDHALWIMISCNLIEICNDAQIDAFSIIEIIKLTGIDFVKYADAIKQFNERIPKWIVRSGIGPCQNSQIL